MPVASSRIRGIRARQYVLLALSLTFLCPAASAHAARAISSFHVGLRIIATAQKTPRPKAVPVAVRVMAPKTAANDSCEGESSQIWTLSPSLPQRAKSGLLSGAGSYRDGGNNGKKRRISLAKCIIY